MVHHLLPGTPTYTSVNSRGQEVKPNSEEPKYVLMSCLDCFPEGKVTRMKVKDENDKIVGDTFREKGALITRLDGSVDPCKNHKFIVTGELVNRSEITKDFEYNQELCSFALAARISTILILVTLVITTIIV